MAPKLAVVAFFASVVGCGGTQERFDGAAFRDGKISFRVNTVPSSWERIDVTDASLAFRDASHDGSVLVNGRCGERSIDDTPLSALTGHLVMGTTEREFEVETVVPLDSREALHTKMKAKLDGVQMAYDIFVLKKDGCVYDFVYVAPPDRTGGSTEFERFVMGFRTAGAGAL
ncbi:MAG: hypothetical protein ABIP39_11045 [Polyangiaceae bacterium]